MSILNFHPQTSDRRPHYFQSLIARVSEMFHHRPSEDEMGDYFPASSTFE